MEGIAIAGEKIVSIMYTVTYYVTIVAGIGASLLHISKKDIKGAINAVLGFGGAFAAVYALRWILDLVKTTFG